MVDVAGPWEVWLRFFSKHMRLRATILDSSIFTVYVAEYHGNVKDTVQVEMFLGET